jgi:hypothetical protein
MSEPETGEAPFHPAASMFPIMSGDELQELAGDIAKHGLREEITKDRDGRILDGRNRLRACQIAKVAPRFNAFDGDDTTAFVVSMNLHRRHLTQEQKREIVAKLLKEAPQRSDRATAKLARVDKITVAAERQKLEAGGEIPHPEKRVGSNGTQQKATKPPKSSPDKPKPKPKPELRVISFPKNPSLGRDEAVVAISAIVRKDGGAEGIRAIIRTIFGAVQIDQIPLHTRAELAREFLKGLQIPPVV